jgi:hypothetical protein
MRRHAVNVNGTHKRVVCFFVVEDIKQYLSTIWTNFFFLFLPLLSTVIINEFIQKGEESGRSGRGEHRG